MKKDERSVKEVFKDLFCAVDDKDILKDERGVLYLGKNKLVDAEIGAITEEAKYIVKTKLWSIWQNTLKEIAKQTMFEKSKDFNDMMSGKLLLYALKVIEDITKRFENYKIIEKK